MKYNKIVLEKFILELTSDPILLNGLYDFARAEYPYMRKMSDTDLHKEVDGMMANKEAAPALARFYQIFLENQKDK